jgi:hypothetical protein
VHFTHSSRASEMAQNAEENGHFTPIDSAEAEGFRIVCILGYLCFCWNVSRPVIV